MLRDPIVLRDKECTHENSALTEVWPKILIGEEE
jgi:hypothetical protein